jgi:hypothetical protein
LLVPSDRTATATGNSGSGFEGRPVLQDGLRQRIEATSVDSALSGALVEVGQITTMPEPDVVLRITPRPP